MPSGFSHHGNAETDSPYEKIPGKLLGEGKGKV
jgi:hypothetical protein